MFKMTSKYMKKDKRGLTWQELAPWLIGVAVLVLVLVFAFLLKDQLLGMVDYIKNLFRGG